MSQIPSQPSAINNLASSIVGARQKNQVTTEEKVSQNQSAQKDSLELSTSLKAEGITETENNTDRDADGRQAYGGESSADAESSEMQPEEEQTAQQDPVQETATQEPEADDQAPPHLDLLA